MNYELIIGLTIFAAVMTVFGTIAAFGRKSFEIATLSYGTAWFVSMLWVMLDFLETDRVGATTVSTALDTYFMLVMVGMCFLCYKYDMRWKEFLSCRLEEARQANLKHKRDLLTGVGVIEVAEGDLVKLSVKAKETEKIVGGRKQFGFTAESTGDSVAEAVDNLAWRCIFIADTETWASSLCVYGNDNELKSRYSFADGVWAKEGGL